MKTDAKQGERPDAQIEELRQQLGEAREALEALRRGDVAAVVIADLSAQKRHQEIMASEVFATSVLDQAQDAIVVCDPSGQVIRANQAAERLCGVNPLLQPFGVAFPLRRVIGSSPGDPRPEADLSLFPLASSVQFLRGIEASFIRRDGCRVDLLLSAGQMLDFERKLLGTVVTMTDITERKRAEDALRELNAQLEHRVQERTAEVRASSRYARSLIEASLDPLVTICAEGKITDVNDASVQATGVPREELIGTDFSNYFTEPDKARGGYQQVFREGFVRDYPLAIRHVSGRVTDVLYNATLYRNEAGDVQGVFAAARDVTERKRAEAELARHRERLEELVEERTVALRESEERLRIALEAADFGTWDIDPATGICVRSPRHDQIFGYQELQPEWTIEIAERHILPEDLPRVRKAHARALKTGEMSLEARVRWPDGSVHWIASLGRAYYDREGRPVRLIGVVADVTERKRAQEQLFAANQRLQAIMEAVPVGVSFSDDPTCQFITGNPAVLAQFEVRPEDNLSASALDTSARAAGAVFPGGTAVKR